MELSPFMKKMLRDDLDYYCIPVPKELQTSLSLLQWDINRKFNQCRFSNNNLTVTKSYEPENNELIMMYDPWTCGGYYNYNY